MKYVKKKKKLLLARTEARRNQKKFVVLYFRSLKALTDCHNADNYRYSEKSETA